MMGALNYIKSIRNNINHADEDMLIFSLGILYSIGFIAGLFDIKSLFIINLIFIIINLFLIYIYSGINIIIITITIYLASLSFGEKALSHDVLNIELPIYFDWIMGIKGAFWSYSKLPSIYYGISYQISKLWFSIFYATTILTLCCSINYLSNDSIKKYKAYFYTILFLLINNLFIKIFYLGKGDILCSAFLFIALKCALDIIYGKNNGYKISIFIIFSSLAINTKIGAVLFVVPTALILLPSIKSYFKNFLPIVISILLGLLNFYPFLYNLTKFNSLGDKALAIRGYQTSLIYNLAEFVKLGVNFPLHLIPTTIIFIFIFSIQNLIIRNFNIRTFYIVLVLIFYTLLMPYVFLHGANNPENFRLINFSLISLFIISWKALDD